MLVPESNERVRAYRISSATVRVVLSLVLLATVGMGIFSVGFFVKQSYQLRAAQLKRENLLLAAEVDQMRSQMAALSESLDTLSEKDARYRVIAGLPEIDPEVQRVGIGGPGTETEASGSLRYLNRALGRKVFNASADLGLLTRRARLISASMDEAVSVLNAHSERLEATPSIAPSDGHLSSLFSRNRRHPVLRITRPHKGIDIAAPVGEPILAPAKGHVRFSGNKPGGYGNVVEIDHGYGYVTRFAHASKLLAKKGQQVERGEAIAEVGATGLVSGPHLHYEVEINGKPVDPLNFIISDAIPD